MLSEERELAVGSGQWAVGSGQLAVGSWQWAVGSGRVSILGDEDPTVERGVRPFAHFY